MIRKTSFVYVVLIVAGVLFWASNSHAGHGPGSAPDMVHVKNTPDAVQNHPVKMSLEQVNSILFGMINEQGRTSLLRRCKRTS